ncbi:polycystin family receptor for egg jelly-like [Amphiura filiformis]|uniref:polycystin family receptor for egg jelly-like n=1 Tax=Amphiura filiformis TaxID=82378 RepID=UPI003B210F30
MPVSVGFQLPATYDIYVIVTNGFSQEIYNVSVTLVEAIANHTCSPMYRPLSITGELVPGKGGHSNIFPVDSPVYFVHTIDAGSDVDYLYGVEGSETLLQEPVMSYQFTQPGRYHVYCYADNVFGTTPQVDFDVILYGNIKGITVTDLGLTQADQPRSIQIDITDLGSNSSLMIDYGDGSNTSVYTCQSCDNPYPDALWEGTLDFATTSIINHIYTTNGSFYISLYGWNLVSDYEVVTLIIVSAYYCGQPSLTIRNRSPSWREPRRVHRKDNVVIEAVTKLGHVCQVDHVIRTWDIQQLNVSSGDDLFEDILLTDLPEDNAMFVSNADTSEIRIPPFYAISYGLFRFTHRVKVVYTNGEIFHLRAEEYVYLEPSDIDVIIVPGQTTLITKGRGQLLLLQPGVLSVDPDQDPAGPQIFDKIKFFCRRVGEPWPLVYGGFLDENPIPDDIDPQNPLYGTGCFRTGPGRLDYISSTYNLDTVGMTAEVTYEIMVVITKDTREGRATLLVKIEEGDVPEPSITCNAGTTCRHNFDVQIINPTSDFRIEVDCQDDCDIQSYEWTLTIKSGNDLIEPVGWRDYATGISTSSMFLGRDVFSLIPEGSEIYFIVEATDTNGDVGVSQMKATLNPPPVPGDCTITPNNIAVFETITIQCSDWTDDDGIVQYEFYVESSSSSIIKVLTFGNSPSVTVAPPVGLATEDFVWNVAVRVTDSLDATTTHVMGQITVSLSEDATRQLFSITNDDLDRGTLYDELIIEDDSHAINWQILLDASILNELNYLDSIPQLYTTTDTAATTLSQNVTNQGTTTKPLSLAQQRELARVTRAYVRRDLTTLLSTSSMDSVADILLVSGSTSVLTSATDELSHQTLTALGSIAETMVSTYDELASSVDQNEVYRVGANILDSITNLYKGSHDSITTPMHAMDAFEASGEGSYSNVIQLVEETVDTTTGFDAAGTISENTLEMKRTQASQLLRNLDESFEKLEQTLAKNKVPREPPYSLNTANGITLTVERSIAAQLTNRQLTEGQGSFDVPSINDLVGSGIGVNDVMDVMRHSMDFNPYNFDSTSERISEDTHLMGLSYYTRDAGNNLLHLPVQQISRDITIKIPRPTTQQPPWNHYTPVPHNDTGMSYHSFNISQDNVSVTVEVKADSPDIRYAVFINYVIPPTVDEYADVFVMPTSMRSPGTNESSSVFSFFVNNTLIGNNRGKYYIGLMEIDDSGNHSNDYVRLMSGEFTSSYSLRTFTSGCSFWRKTDQIWSSGGCVVDVATNHRYTCCLCNHLTSFASTWIVPPTPLDFDYIFANADFKDNITIYVTTIAIYLFFIILFIWARRADNKDLMLLGVAPLPDNSPTDRYYYEIVVVTGHRRNAGTQSKVSFIASGDQDETQVRMFRDDRRKVFNRGSTDRFLMSVSKPLGTLNYMRIWHDNSGIGKHQSWYLNYIAIRDIQTKERFYFIANTWFSVIDGDGQASFYTSLFSLI